MSFTGFLMLTAATNLPKAVFFFTSGVCSFEQKFAFSGGKCISKTVFKGNGDGTVNYRSLIGCTRWADQQKQRVTHHEFPGVDHLQVYTYFLVP